MKKEGLRVRRSLLVTLLALISVPLMASPVLAQHPKEADIPQGFSIELKASEADVTKAVEYVVQDQIIHGTQVYSREDELTDAEPATSSKFYGPWTGEGHAYFKIRHDALSPRHFKDSADIGTITVRYIVLGVEPSRTHLQIDAVFVEDASRKVHESDTTVETSEFAEIQAQIVHIQKEERETAEAAQRQQQLRAAQADTKERTEEAAKLQDAEVSLKGLQVRVHELEHDAEVRVKEKADLKSAPFKRAATLASVPADSQVLVEIITPYWYGVETEDGHRGWLRHDQVDTIQ